MTMFSTVTKSESALPDAFAPTLSPLTAMFCPVVFVMANVVVTGSKTSAVDKEIASPVVTTSGWGAFAFASDQTSQSTTS